MKTSSSRHIGMISTRDARSRTGEKYRYRRTHPATAPFRASSHRGEHPPSAQRPTGSRPGRRRPAWMNRRCVRQCRRCGGALMPGLSFTVRLVLPSPHCGTVTAAVRPGAPGHRGPSGQSAVIEVGDDSTFPAVGHRSDSRARTPAGESAPVPSHAPCSRLPRELRALPPLVDGQLALLGLLLTRRRPEVLVPSAERHFDVEIGRRNRNDPLRKIVRATLKNCFCRVGHDQIFSALPDRTPTTRRGALRPFGS